MSITVFDIKPVIDRNEESFKDLTYPSVRFSYDPYIEGVVTLSDQMSMRPDLLSRAAYGTTQFWDLILKFNGISNPFSIDKDDTFLIPSIDDMREQLAPPGEQTNVMEAVRKQYIDLSKKAQQDPRLAEAEKKRREAQRRKAASSQTPSRNNLPPNIAEEGEREIVIKGGKVYFGPNISENKQECEVPLSKSDFISKIIKNRLKGG